jgi:glycosyltransferase involved in cell wall biosynthesis
MKILMVINCLSKGGRERRMLELIKGLKEKNDDFDIYLISLSDKIDYQYVFDLPIRFEVIRKKDKDLGLIFKLRKVIKRFDPDIIHSWDVMSTGYLTAANMFLNKKLVNCVIYNAATSDEFCERDYNKIRFFTAISDITIANSFAGMKAYKAPARKAVCIYNGIDLGRFDNLKAVDEMEQNLLQQTKGDRYVATMVGAFEDRKDYDTVVEAAIKMCSANKKIIFLLIGEGSNKQRLMQKVPAQLLNTQIRFIGMRDDIESILQISDVGLLISAPTEGLSNSIIEYMAAGLPVIATTGGGTDELVQNGKTGFIIDRQNSSQLIEKLEMLMGDPHLAATIGAQGSKWVRENLDIRKMTDAYIGVYHRLLDKKTKQPKIGALSAESYS